MESLSKMVTRTRTEETQLTNLRSCNNDVTVIMLFLNHSRLQNCGLYGAACVTCRVFLIATPLRGNSSTKIDVLGLCERKA